MLRTFQDFWLSAAGNTDYIYSMKSGIITENSSSCMNLNFAWSLNLSFIAHYWPFVDLGNDWFQHPAVQRVREQSEPMDQSPSPQEGASTPKAVREERAPAPRCSSPVEDYVMVPENIPSDHSAGSNGSKHHPSSVDLNAIFR